jgi:hypothetical protein
MIVSMLVPECEVIVVVSSEAVVSLAPLAHWEMKPIGRKIS